MPGNKAEALRALDEVREILTNRLNTKEPPTLLDVMLLRARVDWAKENLEQIQEVKRVRKPRS